MSEKVTVRTRKLGTCLPRRPHWISGRRQTSVGKEKRLAYLFIYLFIINRTHRYTTIAGQLIAHCVAKIRYDKINFNWKMYEYSCMDTAKSKAEM